MQEQVVKDFNTPLQTCDSLIIHKIRHPGKFDFSFGLQSIFNVEFYVDANSSKFTENIFFVKFLYSHIKARYFYSLLAHNNQYSMYEKDDNIKKFKTEK